MMTPDRQRNVLAALALDLRQRHQAAFQLTSRDETVTLCRDHGCGAQPYPCRVIQLLDGEPQP